MIRYIPGTDPLDVELYRFTEAERDALVARVRATTTPKRVAAARATASRWEQYRASRPEPPPDRPTPALLASQRMHVTNPGRCAARYAMLAGCTLAAAVWDLHDMGVDVSSRTVSKRWRDLYPGVPASIRQRLIATAGAAPRAHVGLGAR